MAARKWILLAGAALLALLAATWWGNAPRITNEFSIGTLNEPALGTQPLAEGIGFVSGPTISNSFVAHDTRQTGKAGRYSSGGSHLDATGEHIPFYAEFREGPWSKVQAQLLERNVLTGGGSLWLNYTLTLRGAITPDGSQWLFTPSLTGKGPGGEFSVHAACDFFPMSRALTVTVTEKLGRETPRSYSLIVDVLFDGELRIRDG